MGDAAESGYRAVDVGDFYCPAQAPDWTDPARSFRISVDGNDFPQVLLNVWFIGWNRKDRCPLQGAHGFAQVASRKQAVRQVIVVQQQNVDIAMQLAVLEAVVEQVDDVRVVFTGDMLRVGLGQQACVVALRSHVDRKAGFAGNQERLVAELFGGSIRVNAGGELALAAVASAEYVHTQTTLGES